MKSTVEQIRERFDQEVDRFSNLETGQSAAMDAPLLLDLVTEAAAAVSPGAKVVLDVGCGAGNFTLKLLSRLPNLDCHLMDLSRPMLDRAVQRIGALKRPEVVEPRRVTAIQADVRDAPLLPESVDIVLAGSVLHHLRSDAEWLAVFAKFHTALRPGGSVWISDLIAHEDDRLQAIMWARYGEYIQSLRGGGEVGEAYWRQVQGYIEVEDTPKSVEYQLDLLRHVGFDRPSVLHKNGCFAAFGAQKTRTT